MAEIKNFPNNVDAYIGAENVMKWLHGRTSGVFGAADNLSVTAGGGMTLHVADGVGWLANDKADGTVFWNDSKEQTGTELALVVALSDATLPRIDRVVVTWETTDYATKPHIELLQGTPASFPAAPVLTNNTLKRQISLAQVYVSAAVSSITADSITDERLDASVCGLVTDWVGVDTTTMQAQFYALLEKVKTELDQLHAGTAVMTKAQYDPAGGGVNICVQEYECTKSGSIYALVGEGAVGRFKVPAAWSAGDSWTVNGKSVPAYCGADAADGDCVAAGRWITFVYDGTRLDFNGGGGLSAGKLAQATATEADVLANSTFYAAEKGLRTGNVPRLGDWGATLTPGGSVTVPGGKHDGGGVVSAVPLKTAVISMVNGSGSWSYTFTGGTLVGIADIASSSNNPEISRLWREGNTLHMAWSGNGTVNRQITLLYY